VHGYRRPASAEDDVLGCEDWNAGERNSQERDGGPDAGPDLWEDASKSVGMMTSISLGTRGTGDEE